ERTTVQMLLLFCHFPRGKDKGFRGPLTGSSQSFIIYWVGKKKNFGNSTRHNMKTITLQPLILFLAVAGLGQFASAQSDLKLPDTSQAAEVKQRIALTDITVN